MAIPKHLEIARKGREAWNKWRSENPNEGADFTFVDFSLDENRSIAFEGFAFGEQALFVGATFGDEAQFENANFGNEAQFENAKFGDIAKFDGATFGKNAQFTGVTFGTYAQFNRTIFEENARFDSATFSRYADFSRAIFGKKARFDGATFKDSATFTAVEFGDVAQFCGATFEANAHFHGAKFEGSALFGAQRQNKRLTQYTSEVVDINASFPDAGTYFRAIDFSHVQFLGLASFAEREFLSDAVFSAARFYTPPDFRGTKHRENLDWTGVRFSFGGYQKLGPLRIPFRRWTTNSNTIKSLRRLRGIAGEIHAVDAERDLFILERQAERGIFWNDWWRADWRTRLTGWWRPLIATVLMSLYRWCSNCGRSIFLPVFWLVVSNTGFYYLYSAIIGEISSESRGALFDVTFASAIPFGATARPAFQSAVIELFEQGSPGLITIPWQIQVASAAQGITNLVLLFLAGLALRNYFKFR